MRPKLIEEPSCKLLGIGIRGGKVGDEIIVNSGSEPTLLKNSLQHLFKGV